jgi:hypothetical protein
MVLKVNADETRLTDVANNRRFAINNGSIKLLKVISK